MTVKKIVKKTSTKDKKQPKLVKQRIKKLKMNLSEMVE
jgi:hypothetical protein